MARKKNIYVVGYDRDSNCVYGKDTTSGYSKGAVAMWIDPLTATSAKKYLKHMNKGAVIYKLVKVSPNKL